MQKCKGGSLPDQPTTYPGTRALDWDDIEIILAICRAESLSGASKALGVNHSTVSRRINAIEEKTGVRFFDRMPGGYFMTEAGEAAKEHGERIETEVNDLSRKVIGRDLDLSGHVRLTCTDGLGVDIVPRLVADFCRDHPNVSVDIVPDYDELDLTRREAEVAIRVTGAPPEAAFGRKACDFGAALYSSRAYLDSVRGRRVTEHDWCVMQGARTRLASMIFEGLDALDQRTVMTSKSPHSIANAVASGLGTMAMVCFIADDDPRLVRISENFPLGLSVWVLTHPNLRRTARIRALMSHLAEGLDRLAPTFAGKVRAGGTDILWPEPG